MLAQCQPVAPPLQKDRCTFTNTLHREGDTSSGFEIYRTQTCVKGEKRMAKGVNVGQTETTVCSGDSIRTRQLPGSFDEVEYIAGIKFRGIEKGEQYTR